MRGPEKTQDALLIVLRDAYAPMTLDEIATKVQDVVDKNHVSAVISKMLDRGLLLRLDRALYGLTADGELEASRFE